jgi:hypothetical protein
MPALHFASGVGIGDVERVAAEEAGAEAVQQVRGAAVRVRLEEGDETATGEAQTRGSECGPDLGRVMGVVVHHSDAGRFANQLEAAGSAAKLGDSGDDVRFRDTENLANRDGGKGVCDVVDAGKLRYEFPPEAFVEFYHKS